MSGTAVSAALRDPDPLYNALVYVPNIPLRSRLPALADGPSCDRCRPLTLDDAVTSAVTGPDGRFTLRDVPAGQGVTLVVQLGAYRMQTTIDVVPCVDNTLEDGSVRLPRNKQEGDIPLTAIATGDEDDLECLLRKIGIEDREFTDPRGDGRIHLYVSNGAVIDNATPSIASLTGLFTGNRGTLSRYTQVLLPCEGIELLKPPVAVQNLLDYVNRGGRVFTTHYGYTWLYDNGLLTSTFVWQPIFGPAQTDNALAASIDTSSAEGVDFERWLRSTSALLIDRPPQVALVEPHLEVAALPPNSGATRWIHTDTPASVQYFTVDTPVGAAPANMCGHVGFSAIHMPAAHADGSVFPASCDGKPLSAQEKVLEFMLLQLGSCAGPLTTAAPTPPPLAPPPPLPPAIPAPPLPPPPLN